MVIGVLLGLLVLVAIVISGFSLYVSTMVRRGAFEPTRRVPPFDVEVIDVQADRIALRPLGADASGGRWRQDGIWGLRSEDGHGRIDGIVDSGNGKVIRQWTPFEGTIVPGDHARVDTTAYPFDPGVAFDLDFRRVEYASPAGQFSGWISDGTRSTWVLFLHGKRAARPRKPPYSYPILPLAAGYGFPCFEASYRNDVDAPEGDGLHWYGLREWVDLEAAVRYALDCGAKKLILVGYSMGGAITTSFLYRSALAEKVVGIILDAPVLDLKAVIDFGVHQRGVPRFLIRPGLWLTRLRFGLDWRSFDYLAKAASLHTPILLIHGNLDTTVPVGTSDRLAELRPDIVTYLRVPDAGHAHSWNVDPRGYEAAVRSFLSALIPSDRDG